MKDKCSHCNQDISKTIISQFEEFEAGRIVCPHCKKDSERYVSEADLTLHLGVTIVIYSFGFIALISLMKMEYNYLMMNLMFTLPFFVLLYFVLKESCLLIYNNSIFKKPWQNEDVFEEKDKVKKRLKRTQIYGTILAIVFGSQDNLVPYFFYLMLAFLAVLFWRYYNLLKQEKTLIKK